MRLNQLKKNAIMKHVKIPILQFSELSAEGRQKALSLLADLNTDYGWWESTYDDAKNISVIIQEFNLEGRHPTIVAIFDNPVYFVAQYILEQHGETCETYKLAKALITKWDELEKSEMDDDQKEEAQGELSDEFEKGLFAEYARMLKEDYDYRTSEAAIVESIEANEYEFLPNGEMWSTYDIAKYQAEEVN